MHRPLWLGRTVGPVLLGGWDSLAVATLSGENFLILLHVGVDYVVTIQFLFVDAVQNHANNFNILFLC